MSVLWLLVGASTLVALGFLIAFIRATRGGQYDDRHTPAVRVLFDDLKATSGGPKPPASTNAEGSSAHGDADRHLR